MNREIAASVTKNTTILFGSQAVTWASSFILMLFLPRYLGSIDYGRLYLAISLLMISHLIIDFGGVYFIPKEIARSKESAASIIANSLVIRFALWVVTFGGLILFSLAAGYPPVVRTLIMILGFSALWEGAGKTIRSCFQGYEKLEYSAAGAIVERVSVTAAGVGALLLGADVVVIALIMAGSTFLNAFISSVLLKKVVSRLARVDLKKAWEILRAGVPYFLWSVFAVIYYRIDAVMMSLMTPAVVVGWYGAAYRFFDVLMFIPTIFTAAVFPVLSRLSKGAGDAMERTTGKSLELIILAAVPVSCCTFLYAGDIIALFFGIEEYAQATPLLQIFSIGLPLVYVDMILGTAILASDRQREWSYVAMGAIPLNMGLNYLFIPWTQSVFSNGGAGAAVATLCTEFAVMVAALKLTPLRLFTAFRFGVVVKAMLSAGAMWVFALFLQSLSLPWVLQAVLAIVAYAFSLYVLGVFEPVEISFIRDFFSLRNLKRMAFVRREAEA